MEGGAKKKQTRTIAIAGGGIAGLTLALSLEQKGFRVVVFEQYERPAASGAGIQLSPNAVKILSKLQLSRAISVTAAAPDFIEIFNGLNGKSLTRLELRNSMMDRHDAPYLLIHRADLLSILRNACSAKSDIEIHHDHQVIDIATHLNGATILTKTGENFREYMAMAVVGADGVWSTIRQHIPNAAQPKFTGSVAWRCLIDMETFSSPFSHTSTGLWIGPMSHVVAYPVRKNQLINIVAVTPSPKKTPKPKGWLDPEDSQTENDIRLAAFKKWHPKVTEMLSQKGVWGGWPIYAVSKVGPISNGIVCLIGDAAHAMEPYGAQGGACAIEDAATLAMYCDNSSENLEVSFKKYQNFRKKRQNQIVKFSRNNGEIYHLKYPSRLIRDMVMRRYSHNRLQMRMDWLYGWTLDGLK